MNVNDQHKKKSSTSDQSKYVQAQYYVIVLRIYSVFQVSVVFFVLHLSVLQLVKRLQAF